MSTLAITGGTGFVGGHLIRLALAEGHNVQALTRRGGVAEPGLEWVPGSLDDHASLDRLCAGADAVIHVAGVVNAPDKAGFHAGNVLGTAAIADAALGQGVRRFIHVSSLAAREPSLSDYGASKAESELVFGASGLDWTIVRPPAIYGPGDGEMLELFRMATRGIMLLPPGGRLSVIHAEDLCRLLLALVPAETAFAATWEPDDGVHGGWSHAELARAIGRAVGRAVRPVAMPAAMLRAGALIDGVVRRRGAKLTPDRVRYFTHPDWVVGHRPPPDLWRPEIATEEGLAATARWYRAEGWLRA